MTDVDAIVRTALGRVQRAHEACVDAAVARERMGTVVVTIQQYEAYQAAWEAARRADRDARSGFAAALRALESALVDAGVL